MPSETLQLLYSARPRGNRRRPKHPVLGACARVIIFIVALGIVIAILIKVGVFNEPVRPVFVAAGLPFCPGLLQQLFNS